MVADARAVVGAFLLVTTLGAGCFSGGTGGSLPDAAGTGPAPALVAPPAANATRTEIEVALDATSDVANATADSWFLLPMRHGPDRPLAGFSWTVPPGAVTQHPWSDEDTTINLEIVPMAPGDPDGVDQLMLLAFAQRDGVAHHESTLTRGIWHEESKLAVQSEVYDYPGSGLEAGYYPLGESDWEAGDEVLFILAAESREAGEFALAFRILDGPFADEDVPAKDLDAFRTNVTGSPVSLTRLGEGSGFSYPVYVDVNIASVFGYEGWTRDVTVRDALPADARPMATVRDVTLSFQHAAERGWGLGFGVYWGTAALGRWEADVAVHGFEGAWRGPVLPALGLAMPEDYYEIVGLPFYSVVNEGEGPSRATFHVTTANTGALDAPLFLGAGLFFEILVLEHVDLGATLPELIGLPGNPWLEAAPGVAGQGPTYSVAFRGDDLVLRGPAMGTVVLGGVGAPVQASS